MTELTALRTEFAKVFHLEGATYQAVIYARRIHYQVGNQMVEIDPRFASADAASGYLADSVGGPVTCRLRRDNRALEISGFGDTILCRPLATSPLADMKIEVLEEQRALAVRDLWPGVDFILRWRGDLLKSYYVIKNESAPEVFEWAFQRSGPGVLKVQRPTALDAAGLSVGVRLEADASTSPNTLRLRWNKARLPWTYPIIIDPTIGAEGNDLSLYYADTWSDDDTADKILVKFNISSIPSGAVITAATVDLYVTQKLSTITCKRAASQTWTEGDPAATLDAIPLGAQLSSKAPGDIVLQAYNSWNVRYGSNADGIEADVSAGNTYFTACFESPSWTATPDSTENTTNLVLGVRQGWDFAANSSEAASNQPRLVVTYTLAKSGSDAGAATEAAALAATLSAADAGEGTDAPSLSASFAAAESASGSEAATLAVMVASNQQVLLSTKVADIQQGQPDYNHGSHADIAVRWNDSIANYRYRSLIEFDLDQLIPQQASQIVQARVRVSFNGALNNHSDTAYNISCHRLTAAWVEAQVTWNSRQTGTPWSSPGGDFASPAVVTISSPDNSGWGTDYLDITQLLKDWLNGTYPNYGVILKWEVESGLKWAVYESDDSTQPEQYKPALVVDYEEAAPAADDILPIATMIRRRRR